MAVSTRERIVELATAAQHRGGRDGRRADGAYFTDADVARRLARRALGGWLLDQAGAVTGPALDRLLAAGEDPVALLVDRATDDQSVLGVVRDLVGRVEVLDPTCGAGSFLVAAWEVLVEVDRRLGLGIACPRSLHGVDCSDDAVDACRATLELVMADLPPSCGHDGCAPWVVLGDAERARALPAVDVLLGNPPFVRAAPDERHGGLATRRVPNRSAWVVERSLAAVRAGGRASFVLPISTTCTDAFAPARAAWDGACAAVLTSHFDTIPSSLFEGVVQRISIYEGRVRGALDDGCAWWTTRYHRWRRDERDALLPAVRHVRAPDAPIAGSLAKLGSELELGLLDRLAQHPPAGRFHADVPRPDNRVLYKRRWSYFLLFTDFVPPIWDADGVLREPTELRALDVVDDLPARVLLAAYSSTLFWWYFSVFTDNRNVNLRDLAAFPLPDLDVAAIERLDALGAELSDALQACAEVRTCTYRSVGTIRNTYFRQGATRPLLDRIDCELAAAYGMSPAQLRFVLDYERRFRS